MPCLYFTWLISFFAILAVWIRGALSRRSGNMCFHISRNKQIIRTRPPQGRTGSDYMGLVRVVGLEPTRLSTTEPKGAVTSVTNRDYTPA